MDPNTNAKLKQIDRFGEEKWEQFYCHLSRIFWEILTSILACVYFW